MPRRLAWALIVLGVLLMTPLALLYVGLAGIGMLLLTGTLIALVRRDRDQPVPPNRSLL